jgi:hypothetical protein
MSRLLKNTLRTVAILVIVAGAAFVWFVAWPVHTIPALEKVDEYVWLDQGWGEGQNTSLRQRYYYTPQGTSMPQGSSAGAVRYSWFVNLELPLSHERFADPGHMRKYRFLVDPQPSPDNPHQLPIGFTRHLDPGIGEEVLDITCAACHTGEIHYTVNGSTRAIRIDGGAAMHAFTDMKRGSFAPELLASLISTQLNPWKFDRFAQKVLGPEYPRGKPELRKAVRKTVLTMLGTGQNYPWKRLYPLQEGFGRTDALGRIGNTVFGDHLDSANYQKGDAPVSYPYLWNIWKFDWVQYNGSVAQPLARNMGQALGVGAITPFVTAKGEPLPPQERFHSTVDIAALTRIEHTLQLLRPPRWPEEILGVIDREKAARGEVLFKQRCQECHGPHLAEPARVLATTPLKNIPGTAWRMEVIPLDHIGTDPTAAMRFIERRYDLSRTGLTNAELADALRPLMTQSLARDVRFRLGELARLREGDSGGPLTAADAAYPQDASGATLPEASFREIEAVLARVFSPLPAVPELDKKPTDYLDCGEDCHLRLLLWDLRHGKANIDHTLGRLDVARLSEGLALNLVGLFIKNRFYADRKIDYATRQCIEGFGTLDLPQEIAGYKPRPLEGVWATPPYLHNGSVPTLYQVLLPPDRRDKKFFVGRREFDPKHVGYVTEPDDDGRDDGFWLKTSKEGNLNIGHAFAADAATWKKHLEDPGANPLPHGVIGPEFTDAERFDLIEYLKIHRDPETPADYQPPVCNLPGESV